MKRTPIRRVSKKKAAANRQLALLIPTEYCEKCGQAPDFRGIHKHHIKKRSQGGTDDRSNIICLCARCHFNDYHGHHEA